MGLVVGEARSVERNLLPLQTRGLNNLLKCTYRNRDKFTSSNSLT